MNHRNKIFVEEYIKSGNATESAKKSGYSEKTAYSQGQRLLKNVEIHQAITKHQEEISKASDVSLSQIVKEIRQIGLTGKNDYIRLKALDMLMKHLGGYESEVRMIQNISSNDFERLSNKLTNQIESWIKETQ